MKLKVMNCVPKDNFYEIEVDYLNGESLYPEGKGGQLGDLGYVDSSRIIKVSDNKILVESPLIEGEYSYVRDEKRRMDAMENHTGEHIFSAVAFLNLGWRTVGFRMAEEYCTLDFDVNLDLIQHDTVSTIESWVNDFICEGHPVVETILNYEEAAKILGERKGIPEKVTGPIRILSTIPGDYNPCGGLHTSNTKDVKLFKILSYERVKSTYTRFYFVCGRKAIEDYSFKHNLINTLSTIYSSQPQTLLDMVNKNLDDKKNLEKDKKELEEKYAKLFFINILQSPLKRLEKDDLSGEFFFLEESQEINAFIKKEFSQQEKHFLLLSKCNDTFSLSSNFLDCNSIFQKIKSVLDLKGGGNAHNINFKFQGNISKLLEIIEI